MVGVGMLLLREGVLMQKYWNEDWSGFTLPNGSSFASIFPNIPISIWAQNAIRCQVIGNFSDRRIKKNISDIDGKESLQLLRQIKPRKI
jgi:hypothetical protein